MSSLLHDFFFQPEPIIWLQRFVGLGHPLPFRILSLLGTTWGVLLVVGLAMWVWGRRDAYAVASAVAILAVANFGLNHLLSVSRPDDPQIVKYEHVSAASFPSGHVATVALLWGLLYARGRVPLLVPLLLLALVSVARLYLGVHYLADVVAGALFGGTLAGVAAWLWPQVETRAACWPLRRWAGAATVLIGVTIAYLAFFARPNPFAWNACGAAVGGTLGALLEHRALRYLRGATSSSRAVAVVVGGAGLLPLLLVERLTGEDQLVLAAFMTGLGAFWVTFVVPALVAAVGDPAHPRRPRSGSTRADGVTAPGGG